ncbi:MAG: helix-turn-helix domain-containing protein [Planctomycetaceae bacterium]|nr:helix-turn-helix domain-containing protein [Planctomycetaceae bacterium]
MSRHTLAAAIYDGLLGFEYSIVAELFGLVRPGLEDRWYNFQPCRVERGPLRSTHAAVLDPPHGLRQLQTADTIVIPGWRTPEAPPRPAFLKALQQADRRGARIVSVCTGAFVLGYAGLLNDRRVTTHWLWADQLQQTFPAAKVTTDRLYVHDERICSSAGSSAGIDLCLSIIRADFGVDVANYVARRMVAPTHREGGQSQYVQPTVLSTDDEDFGPILDWMQTHLHQTWTLEQIADRFAMSLRTFQRRFRSLTGEAPLSWLNAQRVMRARSLLETTDLPVDQIAHRAGLGTAANLRKHFARVMETTPSAYRSAFASS